MVMLSNTSPITKASSTILKVSLLSSICRLELPLLRMSMMWETLLADKSGRIRMVSEVVIIGVVQSRLDNKGLNKVSRDLKD